MFTWMERSLGVDTAAATPAVRPRSSFIIKAVAGAWKKAWHQALSPSNMELLSLMSISGYFSWSQRAFSDESELFMQ